MKYTLYKLKEGFIVTSNKAEEGINPEATCIKENRRYVYKVIAQQNQINFSGLSEEEQKEIGWFDVDDEAERDWIHKERGFEKGYDPKRCIDREIQKPKFINGYRRGFQKAQELLSDRFTLDDLEKVWYGNAMTLDRLIKYLSQPKSWDIEGEWIFDVFKIKKIL